MEAKIYISEAFGRIEVREAVMMDIRLRLAAAYLTKDVRNIRDVAKEVQAFVDAGYDDGEHYCEAIDDYKGQDPEMLARQYVCHVFHDRYLGDDDDQEYIKTGLKPYMMNWQQAPVQLSLNF